MPALQYVCNQADEVHWLSLPKKKLVPQYQLADMLFFTKCKKQAGPKLGQAQFKLELELCFTAIEICFIKLVR